MVLAYQLVFLHSVHIVVCGCTQTAYRELEGLSSVLCWVMWRYLLSLPDRQRLQENYFCFISTVIFTSGKQKYLAGLLFVALFRAVGNKTSRETEGQMLHPFTPLPDHRLDFRREGLEGILDKTESPLSRDAQSGVLFIQYPLLLIIKEFRRKLPSSFTVFVSLNKYTA